MKGLVLGGLYGLCLALLTFGAAAFGHGLFFPLGLISAPLSLLGTRVALFGLPVLWGGIGFLAVREGSFSRVFCALTLAANYVGAVLAWHLFEQWRDTLYWTEVSESIRSTAVAALVLYGGGHIVIWRILLLSRQRGYGAMPRR